VNGKVNVIFEDCGDCDEGCTLQRTLGVLHCSSVVISSTSGKLRSCVEQPILVTIMWDHDREVKPVL